MTKLTLFYTLMIREHSNTIPPLIKYKTFYHKILFLSVAEHTSE